MVALPLLVPVPVKQGESLTVDLDMPRAKVQYERHDDRAKDRHAIPTLLAAPNRMIAGLPDCLRRKFRVGGLELLKADDVGFASRSQVGRFDKRRLMLLMLKLAIFIGSGTDTRHGSGFSVAPQPPSRFGCGHTIDTSSVSPERLTHDLVGPNNN